MTQDEKHALIVLVNAQAEDDGLWFIAETASEAYLQQELRRLHAAVEAEAPLLARVKELEDALQTNWALKCEHEQRARELEREVAQLKATMTRREDYGFDY